MILILTFVFREFTFELAPTLRACAVDIKRYVFGSERLISGLTENLHRRRILDLPHLSASETHKMVMVAYSGIDYLLILGRLVGELMTPDDSRFSKQLDGVVDRRLAYMIAVGLDRIVERLDYEMTVHAKHLVQYGIALGSTPQPAFLKEPVESVSSRRFHLLVVHNPSQR